MIPFTVGVGLGSGIAKGAMAWRKALEPLTPAERQTFLECLRTFEHEMSTDDD
jgi:hypothetical protein